MEHHHAAHSAHYGHAHRVFGDAQIWQGGVSFGLVWRCYGNSPCWRECPIPLLRCSGCSLSFLRLLRVEWAPAFRALQGRRYCERAQGLGLVIQRVRFFLLASPFSSPKRGFLLLFPSFSLLFLKKMQKCLVGNKNCRTFVPAFRRKGRGTPLKTRAIFFCALQKSVCSLKSFPYRRSSTRAALPCVLSGAGYPVSLGERLA